jgi:hypothetical protein
VTIQKVVYRMNRREQNMNEIKTVAEKKSQMTMRFVLSVCKRHQ